MTLNAFLNSAWFRHLARASMIVGTFIAGYAGVTVGQINSRVEGLENANASVKASLQVSAVDTERFQRSTNEDLTILRAALMAVDADITTIKTDAATIRGILQEMQRRDAAARRE